MSADLNHLVVLELDEREAAGRAGLLVPGQPQPGDLRRAAGQTLVVSGDEGFGHLFMRGDAGFGHVSTEAQGLRERSR